MMSISKYFVLLGALAIVAGCGPTPEKTVPSTTETEQIRVLSAGRERGQFTVELAQTDKQHEVGLMGRKELAPDAGMLFLFPHNGRVRFWMKDTLVALDMIFIDQDGRIVKIHENARPLDETYVYSDFPIRAVLELGGGVARQHNINVGDLVLSPALDSLVREGLEND